MVKLTQSIQQRQKLSPQHILQTVLLQMNSIGLEERILAELEENPALELTETELSESNVETEESIEELDWEDIVNVEDDDRLKRSYNKSTKNTETPIQDVLTAVEKLLDQIILLDLSDIDRRVIESIIWNIDEQGYLSTNLDLLAERLNVQIEDVERMLKLVQRLDPPGIGARDLQECLSIQLELSDENTLAKKVIDNFFDDFANRRFERLEEELGCTRNDLNEAIEIISHLNPKPGEGSPTSDADYILPDVIVEEVDGKLLVSINDINLPEIRLSPVYENLLKSKDMKNSDVQKFLQNKVESARWFVQAVQQRQITMIKVMQTIIGRQDLIFSGETSRLRPMILKKIADEIKMDISTVSRVTKGKYVQTPWGVFELKHFFSEGMVMDSGEEVSTKLIKARLKRIIDNENKISPVSDDSIADILKSEGFPVARRTVTKYRDQMKIPVARLRRALV